MIVKAESIGGGVVIRHFTMGGEHVGPGRQLTRDEVLALPVNNRQALIDQGRLDVYPPGGELHLISRGFGKYDVIQGSKLNIEPLSKEQAQAMVPGASEDADPN